MSDRKAPFSPATHKRTQQGSAAIEFALVFPLLLLIFYGIICYSLILLHKQALTSISSEAARSTLAVTEASAIEDEIQRTINAHPWIAERITGCGQGGSFHTLMPDNQLQVCMQTSLPDNPPLPVINLGIFGLPSLPPDTTNMLKTEVAVMWRP